MPVVYFSATVLPQALRVLWGGAREGWDGSGGAVRRHLLETEVDPDDDPTFIIYVMICSCLVCVSAIMSGLFLGLLSLDPVQIEIYKHGGGTEAQKKEADIVWPLISNKGHRLLVTLLLVNFSANEALPIFLDRLVPTWCAFLMSWVFVVFLGEMLPMAIFTGPRQLHLASVMAPLVFALIYVTTPIAYPVAKLLDWVLGENSGITRYNRQQMQTLVNLHHQSSKSRMPVNPEEEGLRSPMVMEGDSLQGEEVKIMFGVLNLVKRTAADVMTPFHHIKMIPLDAKLDEYTLASLVATGHSRIPVYNKTIHNLIGFLMMKNLVTLDPLMEMNVDTIKLYQPVVVHKDTNLKEVLAMFQMGGSHLALVASNPAYVHICWESGAPLHAGTILGLLTCEDVLEELIGEEFQDTPQSTMTSPLHSPLLSPGAEPARTYQTHAAIKSSLSQAYINKFDRLLLRSASLGCKEQGETERPGEVSSLHPSGKKFAYDTLDLPDTMDSMADMHVE